MKMVLLALLLGMLPQLCGAEIYRCIDGRGQELLSDKPCPAGSVSQAMGIADEPPGTRNRLKQRAAAENTNETAEPGLTDSRAALDLRSCEDALHRYENEAGAMRKDRQALGAKRLQAKLRCHATNGARRATPACDEALRRLEIQAGAMNKDKQAIAAARLQARIQCSGTDETVAPEIQSKADTSACKDALRSLENESSSFRHDKQAIAAARLRAKLQCGYDGEGDLDKIIIIRQGR